MADYKASIVTLNNVLKDYPNTKSKELIMYSILETKYQYALKSIDSKRKERFTAAAESYDELIAGFPNGEFSGKAKNIKSSIDKALSN
jgi:outer membrane protein assembly factor BamD